MRKINNLGLMKKMNLWINQEVPVSLKEPIGILETEILKSSWVSWENNTFIVEVCLGQKHMSNYAMLGVQYEYKENDSLKIRVRIDGEEGDILKESIARLGDEVHMGIPKEYGEEILQVSQIYFKTHNCAKGELVFNIGAHGFVGSSKGIFGRVTNILLSYIENSKELNQNHIEQIACNLLKNQVFLIFNNILYEIAEKYNNIQSYIDQRHNLELNVDLETCIKKYNTKLDIYQLSY